MIECGITGIARRRTGLAADVGDFDFLIGTYDVHNRVKRNGVWVEFAGVNRGSRYLDGQSVVDELEATFPDGREVKFMDVHVFDPETGEWSNAIHARGARPDWVIYKGRFVGGIGTFVRFSDGVNERHTWSGITGDAARFQQEVSPDGVAWEVNWIMELRRRV